MKGSDNHADRQILAKSLVFLRRLLYSALIVLAIIWLSFLGLEMARGTAPDEALGIAGRSTARYLSRLAQGDLGNSISVLGGGRTMPVAEVLPGMLVNSLGLLAAALLLATVAGALLGLISAFRRRASVSLLTLTLSLLGMSLPSFFIALLLQLGVVYLVRNWGVKPFPVAGFGWDSRFVLPALVLAARPIAQISRVTSVTLIDVLDRDFVRTAVAKGLPSRTVRWRHIYRHVAIPVLTTIGSSLRFALSSLPVVELFFAWPGAGFNLLRAISARDDALTVGLVASLGILFIAMNWILEASFGRLDPRLREEARRVLESRPSLWRDLRVLLEDIAYVIQHNRLVSAFRRHRDPAASGIADVPEQRDLYRRLLSEQLENGSAYDVSDADRRRERLHAWRRATLMNPPLMLGGIVLILLLGVVILGPTLSPSNPYQLTSLKMVDGRLTSPPFPPSSDYPWGSDAIGRDIMSLVLSGAGRTLSLALLVVLARLGVGFVLGAVAGWRAGGVLDRAIVGLSEIIAAFPTLLLAMILILAMGIRQGINVFIIALCFVGWGEIMLFVRGQVQSIRPQTFIESAVSVGLRSPRIIFSHVFPNLISPLIALGSLEMGATLMLLGELGFVGIFIGGGVLVELIYMMPPFHYSDVPEWGALLSSMRLYARSYPWTAFYPALAFCISILGFNFFGEGLRLLIQRVGVGFTRLLNRYTLVGACIFAVALIWVRGNVGPWQFYREDAQAFQADRAVADISYLAGSSLEGRRVGTQGIEVAAEYIAAQFEELGLNPGAEELKFITANRRLWFGTYDAVPSLAIQRGDGSYEELAYQKEFSVFPTLHAHSGAAQGEVVFMATGSDKTIFWARGRNVPLAIREQRERLRDAFLLVTHDQFYQDAQSDMSAFLGKGVLVIADDPDALGRYQIPAGHGLAYGDEGGNKPVFFISRTLARQILEAAGEDLDQLEARSRALQPSETITVRTGAVMKGAIPTRVHDSEHALDVIGTMTGMNADQDDKLILVMAPYDGLGVGPDGTLYPSANNGASGVATMLEILRSWKETGYQPDKTFMFVAYAAGGQPYGKEPTTPLDPTEFMKVRYAYRNAFTLEAVIRIGPVGGGSGDALLIHAGGNRRLGDLFRHSARSLGVKARLGQEDLDLSILFAAGTTGPGSRMGISKAQEAPTVAILWEGSPTIANTAADAPDRIEADKLRKAGQTISMALMTLGRVTNY